jgi:hypothetical protein
VFSLLVSVALCACKNIRHFFLRIVVTSKHEKVKAFFQLFILCKTVLLCNELLSMVLLVKAQNIVMLKFPCTFQNYTTSDQNTQHNKHQLLSTQYFSFSFELSCSLVFSVNYKTVFVCLIVKKSYASQTLIFQNTPKQTCQNNTIKQTTNFS